MVIRTICLTSALALTAGSALAEMNFNRIASFPVVRNMAEGEDTTRETSPEIIDVTADGMTLVYTDSPLGVIGLIDITDPAHPQPKGNIDMGGEPTSVAVVGTTAFVGVNTSESYGPDQGDQYRRWVRAGCLRPGRSARQPGQGQGRQLHRRGNRERA